MVTRGVLSGVLARIRQRFSPNMLDLGGCSLHHVVNAVSYSARLHNDVIGVTCLVDKYV